MSNNNFDKMKKHAMQNFKNVASVAPGVLSGVKWDDLKDITCECGNKQFYQSSAIKLASPLQSKANMPTLVQLPVGFACSKCNKVNSFDPETMKFITPKNPAGEMKEDGA